MYAALPRSEYYGGSAPKTLFSALTAYPTLGTRPLRFPGSTKRLCPLAGGGTTACAADAALQPLLLRRRSLRSTPYGGERYDKQVALRVTASALQSL
jgi:hypothetical protein